jgi:hypothetical protein
MQATYYSEKLVDCQRTTRYVPEDRTLHNHPCETRKSHKKIEARKSKREKTV